MIRSFTGDGEYKLPTHGDLLSVPAPEGLPAVRAMDYTIFDQAQACPAHFQSFNHEEHEGLEPSHP